MIVNFQFLRSILVSVDFELLSFPAYAGLYPVTLTQRITRKIPSIRVPQVAACFSAAQHTIGSTELEHFFPQLVLQREQNQACCKEEAEILPL